MWSKIRLSFHIVFSLWMSLGWVQRAQAEYFSTDLSSVIPYSFLNALTSMLPEPREMTNAVLCLLAFLGSIVVVKLLLNAQMSAANRHYMTHQYPHAFHRFFVGMTIVVKGLGFLMLYAGCFYGLLQLLPPKPFLQGLDIIGYGIGFYLVLDVIISSFISPRLMSYNRLCTLNDKNSSTLLWVFRSFLVFVFLIYFVQQIIARFHIESSITKSFLQIFVLSGCVYVGILVLLFRKKVSAWLTSQGEDESDHQVKSRHFFAYLAHIWHILVIGSLVFGYSVWAHQGAGELRVVISGFLCTTLILLALKGIFMLIEETQKLLVKHQNDDNTPYKERLILERLNIHLPYVFLLMKGIALCLAFMVVLESWGIKVFVLLDIHWIVYLFRVIIENFIVLLVFMIIWEVFNVIMNYYIRPRMVNGQPVVVSARARTLMPIVRMVGRVLIVLVGGLMVLSTFGVNIAPLLAGLSVFGLAISFGSQTLVKDFVTGLFILLENDIEVGDTVSIGGSIGLVEATTVRNIKLRDPDGALHIIPYSAIDGLVNLSRDYTASTLEFTIGHQESIDQVMALIREVSDELQQDPLYKDKVLAPVIILGLKSISEIGLTILAKIRTQPDPHHLIVLEFYRRIKQKYDTHNIQIPFPKRSVFMHQIAHGVQSPPSHG